jgi:hypothetical protein
MPPARRAVTSGLLGLRFFALFHVRVGLGFAIAFAFARSRVRAFAGEPAAVALAATASPSLRLGIAAAPLVFFACSGPSGAERRAWFSDSTSCLTEKLGHPGLAPCGA